MFYFFLIIVAALINSLIHICLKKVTFNNEVSFFKMLINRFLWLAIFLYVVATILSMIIYKHVELSIVTPVFTGFVFIFLAILSKIIFEEKVTVIRILGMIIILSGISLFMLM